MQRKVRGKSIFTESKISCQHDRRGMSMAEYKCFDCNKEVSQDYLRTRVRCPYCGSKMLFKPRSVATKVKAR